MAKGSNLALPERVHTCLFVFYCMKGGKLLNVSCSTISSLDKKLTNAQLCQNWKTINWHQVEKRVNKLQTRITKAVLQNKWNLAKRLQYLLTHSYCAKLLAVRKVTQNQIACGHPNLKDGVCFGPPARLFWYLELINSTLPGFL